MKLFLIIFLTIFISCNGEQNYTPKPRMYPRINFPDKGMTQFEEDYCSMSFQYPKYFKVEKDEYYFEGKPLDPCWFDLESQDLNCSLHCSYLPIKNKNHFDELVKDVFELAAKHNAKANYRKEQIIENATQNVHGLIFELSGPVASPFQFFVTDSTKHFMRGSVYFNAQVNPDSIAPVYDFVKEDLYLMIESFKWNN